MESNKSKINANDKCLESLPAEILQCKTLTHLNVAKNKLRQLPKNITALQLLKVLNVAENCIEELPGELGQLLRLEEVNASYNQIIGLPLSVGYLRKLNLVNLSHNRLSSLPNALNRLECLTTLDVSYNNITSIDSLPSWIKSIVTLRLQHNILQKLPHWLNGAFKLQDLNVSFNPLILQYKSREYNSENKNNDQNTFRSLRNLDIRHCGIEKSLPIQLLNMPELVDLRLGNEESLPTKLTQTASDDGCNILMELPTELTTVLGPNLQVLDLRHMQLCGLPQDMTPLKNLKVLLLRGNPIMWLPSTFGGLVSLEICDISQCELIELHSSFSGSKIKHLNLANNKLISLPECMKNMPYLENLDLYDNYLEELPEFTMSLPSLKALDFGFNCFLPQEKLHAKDFETYTKMKNCLRECQDLKNRMDLCKEQPKTVRSYSPEDTSAKLSIETSESESGSNCDLLETSSLPESDFLQSNSPPVVNENWDESEDENENDADNFDPAHVSFAPDDPEPRWKKEAQYQRLKFGDLFFCPADSHVSKVVLLKQPTEPVTGQFDD